MAIYTPQEWERVESEKRGLNGVRVGEVVERMMKEMEKLGKAERVWMAKAVAAVLRNYS